MIKLNFDEIIKRIIFPIALFFLGVLYFSAPKMGLIEPILSMNMFQLFGSAMMFLGTSMFLRTLVIWLRKT